MVFIVNAPTLALALTGEPLTDDAIAYLRGALLLLLFFVSVILGARVLFRLVLRRRPPFARRIIASTLFLTCLLWLPVQASHDAPGRPELAGLAVTLLTAVVALGWWLWEAIRSVRHPVASGAASD